MPFFFFLQCAQNLILHLTTLRVYSKPLLNVKEHYFYIYKLDVRTELPGKKSVSGQFLFPSDVRLQKYLLYWTEELGRNCLRGNKVTVFLNWNYLILFLLWVIFQTGNKTIFKWWLKSTVWTFEFGVTICRYFSFSHFFFNLPDFVLIRSFLFCQREKHTK